MRKALEKLALEKASREDWTEEEALEYVRAASTEELKEYVKR